MLNGLGENVADKLPAGHYIVTTGPYEGCDCREVIAECLDDAVTVAVGIDRSALGESNWRVAYGPGETPQACCDCCTVAC